jgi:hypothetical protein
MKGTYFMPEQANDKKKGNDSRTKRVSNTHTSREENDTINQPTYYDSRTPTQVPG